MMVSSVPQLLAMAHGVRWDGGPATCFYCGCRCAEGHAASEYVQGSFTGRADVAAPGSSWVCPGCVLALREDAEVAMIDGVRRRVTKGCMRAFSWVVTADAAAAASRGPAHRVALRAACLGPPPPPWAIVLSGSGKAHLLYRGAVNHDTGGLVVVTLEAERIEYRPQGLAALLGIAGRYCAVSGRPALSEPISANAAIRAIERYPRDGERILDVWGRARGTPIGRLAAWLCGPRESCEEEYPADAR